jgi:serine O-acetyltransferase
MNFCDYFKEYIMADILRFFSEEEVKCGIPMASILRLLGSKEELWAIISYRIGRWIIISIKKGWVRKPLLLVWTIFNSIIRIISGNIIILPSADIGKGLYLHFGPIYIAHVRIGEYCNFSMGNVIGWGGRDDRWGTPTIGNRVFFGPNVIATGKITIGNNVAVGSNSVVNNDLPDNCTAVGIPARIVNFKGSDQLIELRTK